MRSRNLLMCLLVAVLSVVSNGRVEAQTSSHTIHFDANGGVINAITSASVPLSINDGANSMDITVTDGDSNGQNMWLSGDGYMVRKAGYVFTGWYTSTGEKVFNIDGTNAKVVSGEYWKQGKWNVKNDIKLYAQYRPLYVVKENEIVFLPKYAMDGIEGIFSESEKSEFSNLKVPVPEDIDIKVAIDSCVKLKMSVDIIDLAHIAEFNGANGTLKYYQNDQLRNMLDEIMARKQKGDLNQNVLTYYNGATTNQLHAYDEEYVYPNCCAYQSGNGSYQASDGFIVTDGYTMRIKYRIVSSVGIHRRNVSSKSKWGTICVPFPVVVDLPYRADFEKKVSFYRLKNVNSGTMTFCKATGELNDGKDARFIPANTPLIYHIDTDEEFNEFRSYGWDFFVPASGYPNLDDQQATSNDYFSMNTDWELVGARAFKEFYGSNRTVTNENENVIKVSDNNMYYIKDNKFRKIESNLHIYIDPYRCYFMDYSCACAKSSILNFVVLDDEEGATDITNIVDTDTTDNGKIYDLNGVRVQEPVKGRVYIVDGKKKIF